MSRTLRATVPVVSFCVPFALASYHSSQNFGAWDNIGVRYNPVWLAAYGLCFVVAAFIFGIPTLAHRIDQVLLGSFLSVLAPLASASIVYIVWDPLIPRLVVLGTPALLFVWFVAVAYLHGLLRRRSDGVDRVLVVASGDEVAELGEELRFPAERRFAIVASIDPVEAEVTDSLDELVRSSEPAVVVLSAAAQLSQPIVAHIARWHEQGTRVRGLTAFYEEWLGKLPIADLERSSLWFDIRDIHEAQYIRIKRVMDLLVAAVLLPVFLLSIPLVMLCNLKWNRGPLFFRQQRVGHRDSVFTIWKYRTMLANARQDGEGVWTAKDDPRVTPFGALMRRSHVDELPQLINVMLGTLSIVGPRPEQVHYVRELEDKIPFYSLRHVVKPGITGWAQVKYPYGASERDALEKLQYELFYLKHQSPSLDVRVCLRTLRSMLMREGQ